ncbi:Hypp3155 [Branchiostoma lanceolatum]|uniref:Hypp3155 protein n=1 Tax=Branchiostoma lanceolatum TaxID=7740 RepID=A0A8J9ZX93_BRALA|nr:Hypp3155 [Branchiostoma lanceolatum]
MGVSLKPTGSPPCRVSDNRYDDVDTAWRQVQMTCRTTTGRLLSPTRCLNCGVRWTGVRRRHIIRSTTSTLRKRGDTQ